MSATGRALQPRGVVQRRAAWPTLEVIAHLLILFCLVMFRTELSTTDLTTACQISSCIIGFACFTVVRNAPARVWSPSAAYLIMVALFHAGLIVPRAIGFEPTGEVRVPLDLWFFRDSTVVAIWLTNLAFVAYALGTRLAAVRPARHRHATQDDPDLAAVITLVGFVMFVGTLIGWFALVLGTGGTKLMFGSYLGFLDATARLPMPQIYFFTDLGAVLLASSPWSRWHRIAVAAYLMWTLIALPLGLRGEVMFPVLAALSVASYRRVLIKPMRALVLAVALLSAIAVVRNIRLVGLSKVDSAELSLNPLNGLAEMGASLRPVSEVVFWHETGDPFDDGGTYWAPVDRFLYYVIPGWTRLPVDQDFRVMSTLVMARSGPIGFSVVAEAYRNFAAAGVFFVLGFLGFLLGRVSSWPGGQIYQCVAGMTLSALLTHVRNPFVPVPGYFVISFTLVAMIVLAARMRREGRLRRSGSR